MGRKIFKAVKKSFIFLLTVVMLINALPMAVIATEVNPLYIKDVKIITAKSMGDAQKAFDEASKGEEKYLMINTNLNEGTGEDGIYMAYLTTPNKDEAITDIKVMNMNGGFTMTNYQEEVFNKQYKTPLNEMSQKFKNAILEFRQNYNNGYTGAKYAYQVLNFFTVDEVLDESGNPVKLGDLFVSYDIETSYLLKMITLCHVTILSTIYNALTMGVQQPVGSNWIDRLSASNPEVDDDDYTTYYDEANEIYEQVYLFAEKYESIDIDIYTTDSDPNQSLDRYLSDVSNEEKVEKANKEKVEIEKKKKNGTYKDDDEANDDDEEDSALNPFYVIAGELLKTYGYGPSTTDKDGNVIPPEKNLDAVFTDTCIDEEGMVPLVKSLTPGQYAMMCMGGPLNMILYSNAEESFFADFQAKFEEAKSGYTSCSIWAGVDMDVFNNTVAVTEEASREMADTKQYNALICDADSTSDTVIKACELVCAVFDLIAGVSQIAVVLIEVAVETGLLSVATSSIAWGIAYYVFSFLATALGYAGIVITIAIAVYQLVDFFIELYKYYNPDYSEIPTYMYDTTVDEYDENVFVKYTCVTDLSGKNMDVNIWEAKEWVAVYTCTESSAGNPIRADFDYAQGNGITPKDYMPLAKFGEEVAENLNQYDFDDDVNGIYLFFKRDTNPASASTVKYVSNVMLMNADSEFECIQKLERRGFTPINVNLTPDSYDETYTYVGYKLTRSQSNALTDIRLCDDYNAGSIINGAASYGEHGTSNGITLYATKVSCAGTAIKELTVKNNLSEIKDGYEPVNLFSGGPAYNINSGSYCNLFGSRAYYLAFMPLETYTEGPDYLGGINMINSIIGTSKNCFIIRDDGSYTVTARQLLESMGYNYLSENLFSDDDVSMDLCYALSTTKNPHRAIQAIGSISYKSIPDDDYDGGITIAGNITYNGYGYTPVNEIIKGTSYFDTFEKTSEIMIGQTFVKYQINKDNTIGYKADDMISNLYVTGCIPGFQPLEITDLKFTTNPDESGNIRAFYDKETYKAVDIAKGHGPRLSSRPVKSYYLSCNNKNNVTAYGKYINALYVYDKTELSKAYQKQGIDIENEDISLYHVKQQLAQSGATFIYNRNFNPKEFDSDNFLYSSYPDSYNMTLIGMSFTDNQNKALTDIKLVRFSGNTQPPRKYQINGITYTLCSDINVYRRDPSEEGIYDCVYLYATTNPAAGDKITDVVVDGNPMLSGYETVKAYYSYNYDDYRVGKGWVTETVTSERVLYLCEDGTYLHLTRENSGPKPYIGEIYAEETDDNRELALCRLADKGCTEFIDRDLNEGAGGDYIYLGYTKTDDANNAVRDIYLFNTDDSKYSPPMQRQFYGRNYYAVANGLDFNKNAGGTYIYMYQSKDKNTGKPLTALSVGETVPIEDVNIGQYPVKCYDNVYADKLLDLNNKAGGKYLYLTMYKSITEVTYDENGIGIIQGGGLVPGGGFKPYYAQDWLCSSVIGEGSVVMIIICSGVLLGAGALILILRRRRNMKNK